MSRIIRDFIDVPHHGSLDALIESLTRLREQLPPDSEAEVRLRGDDIFGRKLSITYLRPQTEVEQASDERCRSSYLEQRRRRLVELQAELAGSDVSPSELDKAA